MADPWLEVSTAEVVGDWIDYNGHMNEGYYAVAFGDASDDYLIHAGFDEAYRQRERATFYTVETHIRYLDELKLGDPLCFRTWVLGVDERKLHLFHSMRHATDGFVAATQEAFLLHVDMEAPAVRPMTPSLLAAMEHDRVGNRQDWPEGAGRSIRAIRGPA